MSADAGRLDTQKFYKTGIFAWLYRLSFLFVSLYLRRNKSCQEPKEDEEAVDPSLASCRTLFWNGVVDSLRPIEVFLQVVINCLAVAACGMTMAFPAVALPALESAGHTISPVQVSLVGCVYYVMILIGSYSGGLISEESGRRKSLLASMTPSIVGWVVTGISDSLVAFVGGILLLGIGMGLSNSCASVYLTELVSSKWRRVVSAAKGVAFSLGITLVYVLGFIIRKDWKLIALISAAIPVSSFLLGIVFLKESRVWLRRPRRSSTDKYFCGLHRSFWSALVERVDVYKCFYPFNAVLILFQLSGATVLITFAVSLLGDVGLAGKVDPYIMAIALGLCHMTGPVLAELFSSQLGVRRTLVYSGTFMSLSILFLARLHRISGVRIEDWPPFTVEAFIALFVCCSSIFSSVTGDQQERIFPTDVRRACCSLSTFNSWVGSCLAVVTYPVMAKCWGFNDLFMIYATCCVLCSILTIMLLPDLVEQPIIETPFIGDSQQLVPSNKIENVTSEQLVAHGKEQLNVQPQGPTVVPKSQPQVPFDVPEVQPLDPSSATLKLQPTEQTKLQSAKQRNVQAKIEHSRPNTQSVQILKTQIREQPTKLTVQNLTTAQRK